MARWIDAVMSWLKWPVAAWVLLSVPQLALADLDLIRRSLRTALAPFWLGMAGYLVVWWLLLRRQIWGQFLATLLHELTHGLFALLTLHRVVSLKATWSSGGEIQYTGSGNWLITIAPYFFPLAMLTAVPILVVLQPDETIRLALIGVVFGFESAAMWRQVHWGQPDLQKVGAVFTVVFLPGALLWTYGMVLALILGGDSGMVSFVSDNWSSHWRQVWSLGEELLRAVPRP
ncbi:MAG: M50 family metallopeptidase [Myxococcota bacterium]|nr:M50 family metallopeptidase [Myxococcota bacterium]